MRRREFVAGLGTAAVAARIADAQQNEQVRRIGLLMNVGPDDPDGQEAVAAFTRELLRLNWSDGRNVRIETRWAAGKPENFRKYATELVALDPAVIVGASTPAILPLRQATHTLPIVFVAVVDPVGSGLVRALHGQGATSQASHCLSTRLGPNGSSYSKRSRRRRREPQYCETPP